MEVISTDSIVDVLSVFREFSEETMYNVTYSEYNSTVYIANLLRGPSTDVLVVKDGDKIAGVSIVSYESDFIQERFYIRKQYRGTLAGRLLTQRTVEWFDSKECTASFVTATAEVGQDKQFSNLMGKFGYKPNGAVLTRK